MIDPAIKHLAEKLLSRIYKKTITLDVIDNFEREYTVFRAMVSGIEKDQSVIVKYYINSGQPSDDRKDDLHRQQQFLNELFNLKFLSLAELDDIVPELVGYDIDHRMLIIDDKGRLPTVMELLHEHPPTYRPELILSMYMRSLARLHGKSYRFLTTYRQLREQHQLIPLSSDSIINLSDYISELTELSHYLHMSRDTLVELIKQIEETVLNHPTFTSYIHCDTGPQNLLFDGEAAYWIDHDYGTTGLIIVDIAGLFLGFPQSGRGKGIPLHYYNQLLATYHNTILEFIPTLDEPTLMDLLEASLLHWIIGRTVSFWNFILRTRIEKGKVAEAELEVSRERFYAFRDKYIAMYDVYLHLFDGSGAYHQGYVLITQLRNLFERIWGDIPDQISFDYFPCFQ